jgi:hypothetical protein
MTVNNASGTVALSGGAITNTSFAKSGAGSATIDNDMASLGGLSMSAGGLTLNGATTVAGSLALSGGTIDGASFTNSGCGSLTGAGDVFGITTNRGAITIQADTQVWDDFTNAAGATTFVQNGMLTVLGTLTNNGTIIGPVVTPLTDGENYFRWGRFCRDHGVSLMAVNGFKDGQLVAGAGEACLGLGSHELSGYLYVGDPDNLSRNMREATERYRGVFRGEETWGAGTIRRENRRKQRCIGCAVVSVLTP